MNATRLGLCRTDADEPTIVGSSADGGANKQRDEGRQKEDTHPRSGNPEWQQALEHHSPCSSGEQHGNAKCAGPNRIDLDQAHPADGYMPEMLGA
jgi:hypothetical protein